MKKVLLLVLTIVVSGAVVAGTVLALMPSARQIAGATSSIDEPIDLAALDNLAVRSVVYAADGSVLATLHAQENRAPVTLAKVPHTVIASILAVEDSEFYRHPGVDFRGMARALVENVSAGGIEQGGSTITQQLVKNSLLSSHRDLERKTREAALALRLEHLLSKDQILEKYLNTVYFGAGAYGVQAAAETYWGRDVGELGWAEGAMLAGLIANPTRFDPTLHPEEAALRRQAALDRLAALGDITSDEARLYGHAPLPIRRCGEGVVDRPLSCGAVQLPPPDDYFVEQVKQQLLDDPRLGATKDERVSAVFGGGLRVFTTLDPSAQAQAEAARDRVLPANDQGVEAAMVAVDSATGAVRALVGGPGFDRVQYDIATSKPGRQTGSSFKTFVLLTALQEGNLPDDTLAGGGSFPNPGGTPDPYVVEGRGGTLTSVTTASSNGAFVRLGGIVGRRNVIDLARRLGISGWLDPRILSLPLGTSLTTPLEMASAYSAIPNGGIHEPAYFIDRVEDAEGHVLVQHGPGGTRAVTAATACYATQILAANVLRGTGTRARLPKQVAAGKTGTSQDFADAWFIGFTPYLTTAVWLGNPAKRLPIDTLGGRTNFGGTYPALMWQAFNAAYHEGRAPVAFPTCPEPGRRARAVVGPGATGTSGRAYSSSRSSPRTTRRPSGRGSPPTTTRTTPTTPEPNPPPTAQHDPNKKGGPEAGPPGKT